MSALDQNSIDALLAQVQADADAVTTAATPADAAAVAAVATDAADVAALAGAAEMPSPQEATHSDKGGLNETSDFPPPSSAAVGGIGGGMPGADVRRLLAIEVPVIVQLGIRRMTVGEVMRLGVGAIVEFGKSAEEELDLLANNKAIGKGHAVKVGENFGIKISSISPVKETIRKLGGI
jgi:flagellar motor switch protein FliN/FliY